MSVTYKCNSCDHKYLMMVDVCPKCKSSDIASIEVVIADASNYIEIRILKFLLMGLLAVLASLPIGWLVNAIFNFSAFKMQFFGANCSTGELILYKSVMCLCAIISIFIGLKFGYNKFIKGGIK